jgi:DNA-binding beta-propeller fold protein YncE
MPAMAVQYSTAMDPQTGTVVYYSEGTVYRFDRSEEGTYLLGSQRDLELQESALLDISGACITVATAEGRLRVLNVQDLTTLTEDQLPAGELPRAVAAAPDGSTHAVLTHSGSLWLVNAQSGKPIDWRPEQDGSTHTVSYSADGSLIVSDGRQSVYRYQVEAPAPQTSFETETEWLVNAYDYFFLPLYTVLPKPAELDNLALYTMTGETSLNVNEGQPAVSGRRELLEERVSFDVWKPLWSNIAFVVVILGLGCLYVSRRDF